MIKSGSDPSLTASVKVNVLTQAELDKEYSEPEGTNYKLIGENCYSLDATTLDFSFADRYKLVNSNLFNSDMTNNTIRNVRREIRFLREKRRICKKC